MAKILLQDLDMGIVLKNKATPKPLRGTLLLLFLGF